MRHYSQRARPVTLVVAMLLFGGVVRAEEAAPKNVADDGFKSLFDGVGLTGWQQLFGHGEDVEWQVREGALYCRDTMSETLFNLHCRTPLPADVALRFSWKEDADNDEIFKDGWLGLLMPLKDHVDAGVTPPKIRYSSTSLLSCAAGGNLVQLRSTAIDIGESAEEFVLPTYARTETPQLARPIGEWNQAEIIIRGSTIEYRLNGRIAQSFDVAGAEAVKDKTLQAMGEHWTARKRNGLRLSLSPAGSGASYRDIRYKDLTVEKR